ncbi:hypothetical protein DQ384_02650 [Sphaerisporangium album]|uniref:Uncharacterized protein n=1 Tax=Sphaerisporangium album TaxID=509200 RepID=A0A367FU65_9ACTN|nr:hypothetical protein [Sphaerisporangium album]RCG33332.1 hypothetical protein DQ384_02650 [Sphaerisporangium album]
MTALLSPLSAAPVQFLWGTTVFVDEADLRGIIHADARLPEKGPICEDLDPELFVADQAALEAVFLSTFNATADMDGAPPVTSVTVRIQGWREGHGVPAAADVSPYVGWCCLSATAAPSTAESGCLSLADPRAGSDLTAMPGLPWGRQVLIRPVPGALAVAPGWLTYSIVPVEHGQSLVVAVATCSR